MPLADLGADVLQVLALAGGEVVQAHHLLLELEQVLGEVRADEAGGARHEPGAAAALMRCRAVS